MKIIIVLLALVGSFSLFRFFIKPFLDAIIFGFMYTIFDFCLYRKNKVTLNKWIKHFAVNPWKQSWKWLSDPLFYNHGTRIECNGWVFDCPYRIRKQKQANKKDNRRETSGLCRG